MLIEPFRFDAPCFVKAARCRPTVAASQCLAVDLHLFVLPALVLLLRDLGLILLAANVFACEWLSVRNIITRSIQEIDWTDGVYGVLPTAKPLEVLKAIDSMLVMGAAMDPAALKAGVLAHSEAIGRVDSKGVTTLEDYGHQRRHWPHDCVRAGLQDHGRVQRLQQVQLGQGCGPLHDVQGER